MKKILFTLAPVVLLLAAVLLLFADSEPGVPAVDRPVVKRVRTALVENARLERRARFSGVLRAADRASLSFTLHGRMVTRSVDIGDRVEKGQVVAQLDKQPYINALEGARSNLAELKARQAQSRRDLERVRRLVAEKAAPVEELEKVGSGSESLAAAIEAATAQVAEAERQLKETQLPAPFSGVVTRVYLEPGEFAQGGRPVLALSGKDDLELEVEVPESVLMTLKPGGEAEVLLPMSGDRSVRGRVASVGRAASGPGSLFPVIISLDAGNLVPGQTAELLLDLSERDQLTVPIQAVFNPGGSQPRVYRVRNGIANRIPVKVGRVVSQKVTVNGELEAGDQVVTGGFFGLTDNEQVEVIQ
ncbi:MAG: efflux RND transporter periplasmic adaptor subunit [Acidobacteriota bacterium]|nr:efflux RND transporter periplasmic adaptor subunit [Acidobacteriota bacterium]